MLTTSLGYPNHLEQPNNAYEKLNFPLEPRSNSITNSDNGFSSIISGINLYPQPMRSPTSATYLAKIQTFALRLKDIALSTFKGLNVNPFKSEFSDPKFLITPYIIQAAHDSSSIKNGNGNFSNAYIKPKMSSGEIVISHSPVIHSQTCFNSSLLQTASQPTDNNTIKTTSAQFKNRNRILSFLQESKSLTQLKINGDGYCGVRAALAIILQHKSTQNQGTVSEFLNEIGIANHSEFNSSNFSLNSQGKFADILEAQFMKHLKSKGYDTFNIGDDTLFNICQTYCKIGLQFISDSNDIGLYLREPMNPSNQVSPVVIRHQAGINAKGEHVQSNDHWDIWLPKEMPQLNNSLERAPLL